MKKKMEKKSLEKALVAVKKPMMMKSKKMPSVACKMKKAKKGG